MHINEALDSISLAAIFNMLLSIKRMTNALIRLCGCAGWSARLIFANNEDRFSQSEAHLVHIVKASSDSSDHSVLIRSPPVQSLLTCEPVRTLLAVRFYGVDSVVFLLLIVWCSSLEITLPRKRELVALLKLCCSCLCSVSQPHTAMENFCSL